MKQLVPAGTPVDEMDATEWMGGFWICEGMSGFTGVFRHEDTPDEAGGLVIDFRELSPSDIARIFETIHLPLRPGMTLEEVRSVLGEPEKTQLFVADAKSYDFTVGSQYPYHVSANIHDTEGLNCVDVIRKDVLSKCEP